MMVIRGGTAGVGGVDKYRINRFIDIVDHRIKK